MIHTLEKILAASVALRDLDPDSIKILAGCAANVRFNAGEYLFHEGGESVKFYVLRAGKVALEINAPGRGVITVQTLGEGEIVGWSSIVPPIKKTFDVRAIELTRALSFDGDCVRQKCKDDPKFGYELFKVFSSVISQRLQATRLQLLDLYAPHS